MFVTSLEQFEDLVASKSRETIYLGGELVFMSNNRVTDDFDEYDVDRYIQQPPRLADRGRFTRSSRSYLFISVDKDAASLASAYRGPVVLAADQYLAYGLAQKTDVIVIGGGEIADGDYNLELFVFTDQRLAATFELNTRLTSYALDVNLKEVLADYPGHDIHWCAPLDSPPVCEATGREGFQEVGDEPIRNLVKRKLHLKDQGVEEGWGFLPAFGVAGAAALVLLGTIGYQMSGITSERDEYKSEISGFEAAYNNSAQSLNLLRHRDFLLNSPNTSLDRLALLDRLLTNMASIDRVLIRSVRVFATDDADNVADAQRVAVGQEDANGADLFRIEFSVPKQGDLGARDQAEPLVAMLSYQTGSRVRVINHVSEEVSIGKADLPYWRYQVGGGVAP